MPEIVCGTLVILGLFTRLAADSADRHLIGFVLLTVRRAPPLVVVIISAL
jgi:hypothetical protein